MMKYKIKIKSGGWWRNFNDGSVQVFDSRRVAEQIISNWMINGEAVEVPLQTGSNKRIPTKSYDYRPTNKSAY